MKEGIEILVYLDICKQLSLTKSSRSLHMLAYVYHMITVLKQQNENLLHSLAVWLLCFILQPPEVQIVRQHQAGSLMVLTRPLMMCVPVPHPAVLSLQLLVLSYRTVSNFVPVSRHQDQGT